MISGDFEEWWATLTAREKTVIGINNAKFVWGCAAKAERDACAKLADDKMMDTSALLSMPPKSSAAWNIAQAIRARGNA